MNRLALLATAVLGLGLTTQALAATRWGEGVYAWFAGDEHAHVGSPIARPDDLEVTASRDLNLLASHIRLGWNNGSALELETSRDQPTSTVIAYHIGSPDRKPIQIGGWADGQDVVSLIAAGSVSQRSDIQQWRAGATVQTAIDGKGRLRLGQIVIFTRVHRGRVQLVAELPSGERQVLASGHR